MTSCSKRWELWAAEPTGRVGRDRLHRSEDKNGFLSRLRGNILQRGSLRWLRPDRQAGACHLVEVAGNRTSKNEKWQDIDLLIAPVQTHRCGQEEGVCGSGGSGYQAFTSDKETRKKNKKKTGKKGRFINWLPRLNLCSTFFMCFKVIRATFLKFVKNWAWLFAEVYEWQVKYRIDSVHGSYVCCNCYR